MGSGEAKRTRICRPWIRARDVRDEVGKRVVKLCCRVVADERGMPRTLKRTRAWAYILMLDISE